MPGFGDKAFGHGPFGEWDWSRHVLYDLLPEVYRLEDAKEGGSLQKWTESIRVPLDEARRMARDFPTIRDPLLVRSAESGQTQVLLGRVLEPLAKVELSGNLGSFDSSGNFVAADGSFTERDIGKTLEVSRASTASNNRSYLIVSYQSSKSVGLYPAPTAEVGPLHWELRSPLETPDRLKIEVVEGSVEAVLPGWELYDGATSFEILTRSEFLENGKTLTLREGADGAISASGTFVASTGKFSYHDVGRRLFLTGTQDQDGVYEIRDVVSTTEVKLDQALSQEVGPLGWAVRPRPVIEIAGNLRPKGTILIEGTDGSVTLSSSVSRVKSPQALFTQDHVGAVLRIRGSGSTPSNDGDYRIVSVVDATTVEVDGYLSTDPNNGALRWNVREATTAIATAYALVRAPSLLVPLAKDFGVSVDTQESEARKRTLVANTSRWIHLKGTERGYNVLAKISGYIPYVDQLFAIDPGPSTPVPGNARVEYVDPKPGKSGSDGSLTLSNGFQLDAPSASFEHTDTGREIRIKGSGSGNDGVFKILEVVSPTTVKISFPPSAVTPDANNGAIQWFVLDLYTTLPPTIPRVGDFNPDLFEAYVAQQVTDGILPPTAFFRADRYSWEDGYSPYLRVSFSSVTQIGPYRYEIVADDTLYGSLKTVLDLGTWKVTDSDGTQFYIETVPVQVTSTSYKFEAVSKTAPVVTPSGSYAVIEYVSPVQPRRDYAPAWRILAAFEPDSIILDAGLSRENEFDRIVRRVGEAVPAHAAIIPRLRVPISVSVPISVGIAPGLEIGKTVNVPVSRQFDRFPESALGFAFGPDRGVIRAGISPATSQVLTGRSTLSASGTVV